MRIFFQKPQKGLKPTIIHEITPEFFLLECPQEFPDSRPVPTGTIMHSSSNISAVCHVSSFSGEGLHDTEIILSMGDYTATVVSNRTSNSEEHFIWYLFLLWL